MYDHTYSTRSSGKGYGNDNPDGKLSPRLAFLPKSKMQWAFVVILFVQAVAVLVLESWALAVFESSLGPNAFDPLYQPEGPTPLDQDGNKLQFPPGYVPYSRSLPTFLALYIFGLIYELGLAWDALRLKNTIQIIGIGFFNVALLLYGAVQQVQIRDSLGVLEPVLQLDDGKVPQDVKDHLSQVVVAVPVIIGVFTVALLWVGWKLYNEFAWTIYKHVSADLKLRRRYMIFEIYIALLKFDFFFFLAFTMEFLVLLASNSQDAEFYLTIVAVPVTIIVLIVAAIVVRREIKSFMLLVLLFYVVGLAYFLFKLVRIWTRGSHHELYAPAEKPLTVFAVITLILLLVTFGIAVKCMRNFNQGLKPYVVRSRRAAQGHNDKVQMNDLPNPHHHTTSSSMPDNRMVIE